MSFQYSDLHKEETTLSNENEMKISSIQNVIKNKYSKAYANRLEYEHHVKEAMKPLTSSPTTITYGKKDEKEFDLNELCVKLRSLIKTEIAGNEYQTHEISFIIAKLRELEIIV